MQKIGVFLSSRSELSQQFHASAKAVGRWIGETGRTLVYGGSRSGLMEVLAEAVKESGGRVFGVVPQIICDRNRVSSHIDVEFRTADLNDRKAVLMRESDILVALPGGVGTLDEVFTALGAHSIGTGDKTVVLFNVDKCWTPLLDTLDALRERGLLGSELQQSLKVAETIEELEVICKSLNTP